MEFHVSGENIIYNFHTLCAFIKSQITCDNSSVARHDKAEADQRSHKRKH